MESKFDTGVSSFAGDMDTFGENSNEYQTLLMANKKLLLDKQSADLTIRLVNGESVSAHCAVVACRCSHLLPTYNEGEHDNHHKRVIKVKGIANAQLAPYAISSTTCCRTSEARRKATTTEITIISQPQNDQKHDYQQRQRVTFLLSVLLHSTSRGP